MTSIHFSLCNRSRRSALFFMLLGICSLAEFARGQGFTPQARLSSEVTNDFARQNVQISGNTALVTSNDGVYVYVRSGNTWTQQTILVPSDGNDGCPSSFSPLAFRGDTAVIGCAGKTIGGNPNQGAAYVFVRNGTIWTEQQRLLSSDGAVNDRFGSAVAISGNTVIVSALTDTVGGNANQGSGYIFVREGSTWSEQARLFASDGGSRHGFGRTVAIDGDTAVVGRLYDMFASPNDPSVYVFVRTGTTWQQQQKIAGCEPSANCHFGYAFAVKGNSLLVGNESLNVGSNTSQGGVYYFTRSGSAWSQRQLLTAENGQPNDRFGAAVEFSDRDLVIGAPGEFSTFGRVYTYGPATDGWSFRQELSNGQSPNLFGAKLDLDGSSLIVGSIRDLSTPNGFIGASYIFTRSVAGPYFDFDGDGKTDIGIVRPLTAVEWWINRSSTGLTFALQFGTSTDRIVPADYTGDGKTDIAFWRPADGNWYVLRSEDFSFFAFPFGANGDTPVPGDYDADGKADAAVFRPSSATWFISQSGGGGTRIFQFGASADKPIVGDYDGDGKSDVAIWRPNAGGAEWWINRSTAGLLAMQFGANADKAVPGDYTGDGKTDAAFWRPASGEWFIIRSEDFSFFAFPFGANGDTPAPGDYDGDGKTDPTVFRPASATWFIARSTAGTQIVQFGANGDRPVPNAFLP